MADPTKQPVVIEHQSDTKKNTQQEKKQGYIKDSASKV
ncbi:TIGR03899 family protein, partial [Vibrio alginolyticus]